MSDLLNRRLSSSTRLRRAGLWVVAFFWLIQFMELTAIAFVEGGAKTFDLLVPRALIAVVGILLSLAIIEVVVRSADRPFRKRLLRTVLAAIATCVVLVPVNFGIFYITNRGGWLQYDFITFVYTAFTWSWFFFTVGGALLALTYSLDAAERDRHLARVEGEAKDARLAALRYQLNPHFLFNTLNSVAALIGSGDSAQAERMVENLSDFLRATLEVDPLNDIELAQEVRLQSLYLDIERERFPKRLVSTCEIPPDLAHARVPALITQPLVENAVRHAVARTLRPVRIRISAHAERGRLHVTVEDDAPAASTAAPGGTGLGLANVRGRLQGRFGKDQQLVCGGKAGGGFSATAILPLSFGR